ncbi:MAG: 1-deoxy-D-xylulose-5-phosphate reductoisomerase [Bacteroidetes bacterium]|nr:1-deoxy-D-xylulose-5-phosphate reductoisomerase [Bacteroidota bacterium]
MANKKGIAILGSTGSLGKQSMEVISLNPDHFFIELLYASFNTDLLIQQALKFKPNMVVHMDELRQEELSELLYLQGIKCFYGYKSLLQALELEGIDIVFNAISGFSGIKPTLKSLQYGKTLALANKESMVVAGSQVAKLYNEKGGSIIPVDAEHSAVFQCIMGEYSNPIEKIVLTSSGGPLKGKSVEELAGISKSTALSNPHWKMGNKITIDSATLINKGFEIIEACWLYNLNFSQIELLIHPESIVQSMVYFEDGSVKAQLATHDMRIPIQYAFSFPNRIKSDFSRVDLLKIGSLTFEDTDLLAFPNLRLSYHAAEKGGNFPAILNAGNEIAVQAFLTEEIKFNDIFRINEKCLNSINYMEDPNYNDLEDTDKETRQFAKSLIY